MGVGEEQACTALGTALKITGFNTFDIEAPAKGTNRYTADRPFSEDRTCSFTCPQNLLPAPINRGIARMALRLCISYGTTRQRFTLEESERDVRHP